MYDVYPYSMFGFLQLIADGSIKEKKKRKGRKRREYKRTPHQNKKHASRTFGSELWKGNGCPKLTSFWLHFTLKECNLKFTKGSPPRVAGSKAIIVLTNVWCSSIFYVWVSADDNWWQHKQRKRKNASGHLQKNNTSINLDQDYAHTQGTYQLSSFYLSVVLC